MTEFRINTFTARGITFQTIEYDSGEGWKELASSVSEKNKFQFGNVFDATMNDLAQLERTSTPELVGIRQEFIEKFGTTPARVLAIKVLQEHGSEKKGLKLVLSHLSKEHKKSGEAFVSSFAEHGFIRRKGNKIFIPAVLVKQAKAIGDPLQVKKEKMQALFSARTRKPAMHERAKNFVVTQVSRLIRRK